MTKEMRPSHCTDVLTSALAHYARRTTEILGMEVNGRIYDCTHTTILTL